MRPQERPWKEHRVRKAFAALLGILGGVVPVIAQSGVPATPVVHREELVVTASLEEEERDQLPVSVEVIDAEEIEARQATIIAELLATVAGVSVVRSGSPGQVTSVFMRGTESDHTLVLWNGIELNDPYFGGFNWAFLPTDGIARVEVARGPFSALYGSDALGGVVQIFSGEREGGTLRLEIGEDGYARAGLAAGANVGALRLDLAGSLRRGDGRFANEFFDGEDLVARARWQPGEGGSVGLVARINAAEIGIPFSSGEPSPERRIARRERELALPFSAAAGGWKLDGQMSRVATESRFRDPRDFFGFTANDTESEALRLRTVASRRGDGYWLALGGEVERVEVDDRSSFGVALAGAEQRTWALFGELFGQLGPLRLDLGLRHDDNDVFGAETTPKLGIAVHLPSGWRLHAAWGRGFRAPSVGELFFPFTGNPELDPERSESRELGIGWQRRGWRAGLTGFDNRLRNLIDFDFATFSNVNVGRARSRGVEVTLGWQSERLALRLGATRLDAEDRDSGLPLLRRPRESASVVLTARPGAWTLNLTTRHVGARADVDPVTFARRDNPGYTRLDLAAQWRLDERWAPYLRIENLADREYSEALGFPAPRRNLVGGLAVSF
jgi:vitamin B12 transporter